ncbi:hypothetical protein NEUTE1DRAFT_60813 [Neurospora tetrasperma FGSC 2508]|uniref:Transglutaminase-like domain-containing protein n=1 Tax=Neurospora tetrasperma (strain FGSC 2508 / ATCC MYA-4615 / P0657) TaxID=510951 RepID=F8MGE5_NEUT8|nr:uncharacterized protein NEUTE1DRAFT_60813 [Neurospora tetrasperma FGSC 2508]EGO59417.1 hypothetical protein NEUTE1DRAFT_60813 [Neurospora tetrasperma FGSC 2508]EGZ73543.1 hypothetical protein NEUTE2DRAFT_108227 [Neurospora tetrasperma FGSC 2509]
MADVEEPQFNTLAERIAALNQQKNFSAPSTAGKRPPPPPPVRAATDIPVVPPTLPNRNEGLPTPSLPPRPTRAASAIDRPPPLPRRTTEQDIPEDKPMPTVNKKPPPLPSRNSIQHTPPALPSRRPTPSASLPVPGVRRNSNSSDISHLSNVSASSWNNTASSSARTSITSDSGHPLRKLPPAFDQAKLPPLPPTRRELEAKAREAQQEQEREANRSAPPAVSQGPPRLPSRSSLPPPSTASREPPALPSRPSLPPRLPSRPARHSTFPDVEEEPGPPLPNRRLPPPTLSDRPKSVPEPAPPPIPLSSRPTFDAVVSRKANGTEVIPRSVSAPPVGPDCLICRDFSGPDTVAAQHPISSLPRHDTIRYLAHVLCDPFDSPTDKARAIFTWCHHNMAYDTHGFFNNCIPHHSSPAEQIFSGKAVCQGYADVYKAIALAAGLDCVLISGHGKGFGHHDLASGSSVPPEESNHAWNAVRIDGGEWKIIDACWGAGHLGDDRLFHKKFSPEMFYLPNEIIGKKHFPTDRRHFYRSDGRVLTWEEYILGDGPTPCWYGDADKDGLDQFSLEPRTAPIPVYSGEVVRFQFSKVCVHWDPEKNGGGKQYLFVVAIEGRDGRNKDFVPLDTDGFWWWTDIPAIDLGAPGQKITVFAVSTIDNKCARGLTKEEWLRKKGRCAYSFVGICAWDLV